MRKLIYILFCFTLSFSAYTQVNNEIKPYVDFLKKEKSATAKEYILSLFKDHDIVILCERDHREMTQYDLILDVIKDPYFINNVGMVFTEVGGRNLNPELNSFLQNKSLPEDDVDKQTLNFQRNGMFPLWEKPNFSKFIKGIYDINKSLPAGKEVKMEPTDVCYIEGELTVDKAVDMIKNKMMIRDSLMSDYIIGKFDEMKSVNSKSKALVIMNYRHAYRYDMISDNGMKSANVGRFLFEKYSGQVANVLINCYNNSDKFAAINDGKWDAAFQTVNMENTGFNFNNSPFGNDHFECWTGKNDYTYKDIFTGFVFYMPFEKFEMGMGVPRLMEDGFYDEYVKREALFYQSINKMKNETDKPIPAPDTEKIMSMNETQLSKLHTLESVRASIEKWIK